MDKAICCLDKLRTNDSICKSDLNKIKKDTKSLLNELSQHQQFKSCEVKSKLKEVILIENKNEIILKQFLIILSQFSVIGICILIVFILRFIADEVQCKRNGIIITESQDQNKVVVELSDD